MLYYWHINTLTLQETAMVLEGMTVDQKPLKDHIEAVGHRDAFLYANRSSTSPFIITVLWWYSFPSVSTACTKVIRKYKKWRSCKLRPKPACCMKQDLNLRPLPPNWLKCVFWVILNQMYTFLSESPAIVSDWWYCSQVLRSPLWSNFRSDVVASQWRFCFYFLNVKIRAIWAGMQYLMCSSKEKILRNTKARFEYLCLLLCAKKQECKIIFSESCICSCIIKKNVI